MSKIDFVLWITPWMFFLLAVFGLSLVLGDFVIALITKQYWLSPAWLARIGWMSGVYIVFFIVCRMMMRR